MTPAKVDRAALQAARTCGAYSIPHGMGKPWRRRAIKEKRRSNPRELVIAASLIS
jgi:hypothetical protein